MSRSSMQTSFVVSQHFNGDVEVVHNAHVEVCGLDQKNEPLQVRARA